MPLQVPGACEGDERGLEEILALLEGGVYEVNSSEYIDYVCRSLDHPQSHLGNVCTCWSRCSVEDLVNFICQALIGNRKKLLRRSWQDLEGVSARSALVSSLILLVRGSGPNFATF